MIQIERTIDPWKIVNMASQVIIKETNREARVFVEGDACHNPTILHGCCVDYGSLELQAHSLKDNEKIESIPFPEGQVGNDAEPS